MYEWTCPICGQKFSTPRLVGLHKSECKRPTPPTDSELLAEAVELLRRYLKSGRESEYEDVDTDARAFLAKQPTEAQK